MNKIIKLIVILSIISSCSSEESNPVITPISGENSVNLSAPEAGQKSVYVRYIGQCGGIADNMIFTGDTLELTVASEEDQWRFTETLTPKSPLLINEELPESNNFSYELADGYGLILERFNSQLFFFYGNDTLFLENQNKIALVQEACQLTFNEGEIFVGEEIGHFDEFKAGQISVADKDAVSCVPTIFELEAYLIYDQNNLSMSHTLVEDQINGWLQIQ